MDAPSEATVDGNGSRSPRLRGHLLLLRGRSGLTQRTLAALLGISEHAVYKWEAGEGHPSPARLQALIAIYVQRGVFPAGGEEAEARALWAALQREGSQRTPPFDEAWFAALLSQEAVAPAAPASGAPVTVALGAPAGTGGAVTLAPLSEQRPEPLGPGGPDWGEAPDVAAFQGRQAELQSLRSWLREEHRRVVALLGLGGIGKTALATRTAQDLAPHYEGLCWRSLRNAPPPEEWLAAAIAALAPAPPVLPPGLPARLGLLLDLLRERRCLLVLDNLETVLAPGERAVRYRSGYEGYGEALRQLGESAHQSSLLLTSREAPPELALLAGETGPVRTLRLGGLDPAVGRMLLQDKGLAGDEAAWATLVERYGGSPLALKVVGQSVAELFGGDIAAFLAYVTESYGAVFGGLLRLLDEQVARLSPLGRSVLYWLAIEREPVGVARLAADLGSSVGPGAVLEAVTGLAQRSLLERGAQGGTHTLQPVVLEYATERLVAEVGREVVASEPRLLGSHALVQAQAKDYVRRSQEQLIAQPLLEHLHTTSHSAAAVEQRLQDLLAGWRGRPAGEQGYGPGNVINLLRLLRGDLRGLDLSQLALRQAYLAEVEMQDASLVGAHLAEAVLADAFDLPWSLALSADGALLAAGTTTGEVRLWRVADRSPLLALQGHSGLVGALALSGDGRTVASGGVDETVKLWEVPSGRLLATLQGHTGGVHRVALSGDGRLVASGGFDGIVRLWGASPTSGYPRRPLATLQGHSDMVHGVALSADGRLLASGSMDETVKLWEVPSGRPLGTFQAHSGGVLHVALSADGRLLASSGIDGTVKLWEIPSGRPPATLQGHSGAVWHVALSGDGGLLASGGSDGTVRLWEAPSGRPLATLQGHTGAIHGVAVSADGELVAGGGEDGTARLWEIPSGRPLATSPAHSGPIRCVALSGDGGLLASSSWDGTIRLWEVASGQLLATLRGHTGRACGLVLSADGQLVATGGDDGTVRLWEVPSGRLLATLHGHSDPVLGVALSADGGLLASGGQDGTVRLWEAAGGRALATLRGHTDVVLGVALSGDGRLLASGSMDRTVRLWEAPSGRPLATLQGHTGAIHGVALSGDGRLLVSGGDDGTVRIWETSPASGYPERLLAILPGHSGSVWGVALAGDGRLVASGGDDGTVRLWEVSSGVCLRVLQAERRYERMDITGLTGVTEAQRAALLALGAVEYGS